MPLPADESAEWPPRVWAPYAKQIERADAWYSGDEDKLVKLYRGRQSGAPAAEGNVRTWAMTQSELEAEGIKRVHVPAAGDVAAVAADLVFGDAPTLRIPEAHEYTEALAPKSAKAVATEDRLQALLYEDGAAAVMMQAAELAGGLGGVYLRAMWDESVADHPLLTVVHHDRGIPEFRHGRLVAVTLWSELDTSDPSGKVWRHLERYERGAAGKPGVVLHGLYKGTASTLGSRGKLTEHPALEGIVAQADDDGVVVLPDGIEFGVRYIPNRLPNRAHRALPVGTADTAGVEGLMDALDLTMASWVRDIDIGKGRIIVPQEYLEASGGQKGAGLRFNFDRRAFSPLRMGADVSDKTAVIEVVQFDIRNAEHEATANALFARIVQAGGYSPQTFGLEGNGAQQTATEVDAREDRSMRTTAGKQRYWQPQYEDVCEHMLIIDRAIFGGPAEPMRPSVVWPDPETTSLRERAQTLAAIEMARVASTWTKVAMLNPTWTPAEIKTEVDRIAAENQAPDPTMFGGLG